MTIVAMEAACNDIIVNKYLTLLAIDPLSHSLMGSMLLLLAFVKSFNLLQTSAVGIHINATRLTTLYVHS